MKLRTGLITVIAAVMFFLSASIIFGQEASTDVSTDAGTQWVWGEVVSSDSVNKTITLKSIDYETGQEKEVLVTTDDKTTFENAKSFDELKKGDALSIDYMIGADGKMKAKVISVEKLKSEEAAQEKIVPPAPVSINPSEAITKEDTSKEAVAKEAATKEDTSGIPSEE